MERKMRNMLNAMWQECDGDYEHYVDILVNAKFTASEIRREFEEQLPDGIERMETHLRLRHYYSGARD